MRCFTTSLAKCLLVLLGLAVSVQLASRAMSPAAAAAPVVQQRKEIKPLRGEAVRFLVSQLRTRNKGFDRAMRDMERRGKHPLWEASAALPLRDRREQVASLFRPASFREPQDIISDGNGGEMVFITYDGPDGYWDGTVYVHDSTREATYNAVVEDYGAMDTAYWDVVDEVYYPADGSDPVREQPCSADYACLDQAPVASKGKAGGDAAADAVKAGFDPVRGGGWWRNWWGCTRTGCQQSLNGCANSGTFRRLFVCAAVGCTARAIACAL